MSIDRQRIQKMAAAGLTNREIARELGCSHTRVAQVLAQDGRVDIKPVSLKATPEGFTITTSDREIVATAIKRALKRAGIEVR